MTQKIKRGGLRNPKGGRPQLEVKREKHSPTLAPDTKQLAQAIAKERGYTGWGYAVDEAIKKLAQEMGLVYDYHMKGIKDVNASEIEELMTEWGTAQRKANALKLKIKSEVLKIGETQEVGDVRAIYNSWINSSGKKLGSPTVYVSLFK